MRTAIEFLAAFVAGGGALGLACFWFTAPTDSNKTEEQAMMCLLSTVAVGLIGGVGFASWWVFGK